MNNSPGLDRKVLPSFGDPEFEDEFFSYNPDDDPTERQKSRLMNKAEYKAKRQGITLSQWVTIHNVYYKMRRDSKKL